MGQGWAWGFLRKVTGVHAVSSVTCWSRLPRVSSPDWSEPCGASGGRTRPSVALLSLSPVLLELVLKFPSGPLALLPRSPAIHLSLSGLCPRLTQDQPCSPALPAGPGQTLLITGSSTSGTWNLFCFALFHQVISCSFFFFLPFLHSFFYWDKMHIT